ncbi:MAG: helix-turn-helix domain-containing protein [Thermodesulfobacteriota bacterium]
MTVHTKIKPQIIEQDGLPAFAVIPYDKFLKLIEDQKEEEVWIPHEVVRTHVLHNVPLIRSWREHLGLTQEDVAEKAGMSQPAYAKLEKPEANLRTATLKKIAKAMGVSVEQLREED